MCLYTNSPDGHFVIDRHPAHPAVVVASPCSGFGFKFASAVGEILAALLQDRPPGVDLAPFRIGRCARDGPGASGIIRLGFIHDSLSSPYRSTVMP